MPSTYVTLHIGWAVCMLICVHTIAACLQCRCLHIGWAVSMFILGVHTITAYLPIYVTYT